jgi:sugar diacid utilization regulator
MAKTKAKLEEEIHRQRTDDDAQVHLIRRQAEKVLFLPEHVLLVSHSKKVSFFQEAEQFLYLRAVSIQNENAQLRQTLQDLLRQTRTLNDCEQRLEEEQLHLINRLKLVADLKRIRLDNLTSTAMDDLSLSTSRQ